MSADNSCPKSNTYCNVFPLCCSDLPSKRAHCAEQSLEALVAEIPANRLQPVLQIWQRERAEGHDHQMQQRWGKPHHNSDSQTDVRNSVLRRLSPPHKSTSLYKTTNSYQIRYIIYASLSNCFITTDSWHFRTKSIFEQRATI